MSILNKETFWELCRFGIVGVVAVAINYAIYLVLLPYIDKSVAYAIGYVVSFCFNYWLSAHFTFKQEGDKQKKWHRLCRCPCFQLLPPDRTVELLRLVGRAQGLGAPTDVLHRRTKQFPDCTAGVQQT